MVDKNRTRDGDEEDKNPNPRNLRPKQMTTTSKWSQNPGETILKSLDRDLQNQETNPRLKTMNSSRNLDHTEAEV